MDTEWDVVVIGGGISGLATLKCCIDAGLKTLCIERSAAVGGLWQFRPEEAYGVMSFTHINVSKYNYAFSDFPFLVDNDFPHHAQMAAYIKAYVKRFRLTNSIRLNTAVKRVHKPDGSSRWVIETEANGDVLEANLTFTAANVAVASGHHAAPHVPTLPGQNQFQAPIMHSSAFKDAATSGLAGGKRVVVVGIGNSAVDIAENLAASGSQVFLSTRSGAWIVPNYVFGLPTDLLACRAFLWLPWWFATIVFEAIIAMLVGPPKRWGLFPKYRALQAQPTVSATLIHRIQRGQVTVVPNVHGMVGTRVEFTSGEHVENVDAVVLATGFDIGLPFLAANLQGAVVNQASNRINLYKSVFSPTIGASMAFIGFAQPASGGLLTISEMQARWFAEVAAGRRSLPSPAAMEKTIRREEFASMARYSDGSRRHTIQKDPIVYNDDIAGLIGAKPTVWRQPSLAFRLLFSSCGAAQYRLQGPNAWSGARKEVLRTPMAPLWAVTGRVLITLCVGWGVLVAWLAARVLL